MKIKAATLVIALALSGTQALAQTEIQSPAGRQSTIRVENSNGEGRLARCEDFVHNPDGSWSPNKKVDVGTGVTISPGTSFNETAVMSGIRVAAVLNAHCLKQKNQ